MKTSEFKKKVEELGYIATGDAGIDIDGTDGILAHVVEQHRFRVYIYTKVTPELFDLLVKYARTPIEERKDEKKYRLHLPLMKDSGYVNTTGGGEYFLSSKSYLKGYQTIFTISEIAEIEKKYNLESFEREEVIEDE